MIHSALSLTLMVCLAAIALHSCASGGGGDTPVPRPVAYPRITLCDTVYASPAGFPLHFEVNTGATLVADSTASSGQGLWFDIRYPSYKATLHCTLTTVGDTAARNAVIQNRVERISLNIADRHTDITDMTNPHGYTARIYRSPYAAVTPLQFLASTQHSIVSGALMFDTIYQSPDSAMPVIEAIERDLIHAIARMY